MIMKMQRSSMEGARQSPMRRGFRESVLCDADEEVITFWHSGPKRLVEHPVGIRGEGEAVAGIVVAADGVLVDQKRRQT